MIPTSRFSDLEGLEDDNFDEEVQVDPPPREADPPPREADPPESLVTEVPPTDLVNSTAAAPYPDDPNVRPPDLPPQPPRLPKRERRRLARLQRRRR
jgi:hypothetical protein